MIERSEYIETLKQWQNKHIVKVITGIRRCGKSTIMQMFRNSLIDSGVEQEQIVWLNFEDLANEPLLDYRALHNYVKNRLVADKMNYIFFDEIQLVDDFQRVIDSLFLVENVDIYVTGSNAYLLSGEIATLLTGRYVEIKMLPFSFAEYTTYTSALQISQEAAYRSFSETGAMPYVLQLINNREQIHDYLLGLYNTIVLKDVVMRRKISDVRVLESVVRFLADNIGNLTSIKRISDTLTSAGRKTTSHTIESYLSALTDSYIFYSVSRYDTRGLQHLKNGAKYYIADMGLRMVIAGIKTGDIGHILENIVYLELRRRGGDIYVGKVGEAEIDFVVIKNGEKAYYQVSASVRDESTLAREIYPLQRLTDNYPKMLLTLDNDPEVSHNGIRQMYVLDWLLA